MLSEDLIVKYLAGETEVHEENLVRQWISESPENEKQFRDLEKLWNASYALRENATVNTDIAWDKVNSRISAKKHLILPVKRSYLAAASVILILGLGLISFLVSGNKENMIALDISKLKRLELSDGSTVSVSSGQFEYPENFKGSKRKVKFNKGKAYFKVTGNPDKPFIVETSGATITVLGTEFEVNTTDKYTEVRLTEGRVKFEAGGKEKILTPGMTARFEKAGNKIDLIEKEEKPNDFSYETGVLTFNNTSLSSVVEDLNRHYPNYKIELSDARLANCRLSSVFSNEPLGQVLEIITTTLNLKARYSEDGRLIMLTGEGCNL